MNHLVGAASSAIEKLIVEGEAEPLKQFKATYLAHEDAHSSTEATWEVSPEILPESGWRPLDDVTLLRFLRADKRKSEFDPSTSMARLLKALAWRKHMRSDALLANIADEAYENLRIRRWVGIDKSNRPVQFERLGKFLGSGNSKAFTGPEWLAHYARDLETTFQQMRAAAVASGEPITTYLFCADMSGLGGIVWYMGSVIPLLKLLTKEVEAHFPEMVGNIVLFNVPRIFSSLFPMVKAFMDPITAAKIEVHAGVPTERLLSLMPTSALPTEYGGTSTAAYPQTRILSKADGVQEEAAVPVS